MGAGFASGLSRFGQVAGPGIQHAMGTREQLIRNALEKAYREKQIQGLETDNLMKSGNLTQQVADLEDWFGGRANREKSRGYELEKQRVGAEMAAPMAAEDYLQKQAGRVSAEQGAQSATRKNDLDELYEKKERQYSVATDKLRKQLLEVQVDYETAIDPVKRAELASEYQRLTNESLKAQEERTRSQAKMNEFKSTMASVPQKPMAIETRQALKSAQDSISAMGTFEKADPLNEKKTVKSAVVSPGAAGNVVNQLYMLSRSGDRKRFDTYLNMNAKALADRIFNSPDKRSALLYEFNQGIETEPWLGKNTKIGETPGKTIRLGTKFDDYVKFKKAEALQAIKDEAEAVWTAAQGQGGQAAGFRIPDVGAANAPAAGQATGDQLDFMAQFKAENPDATREEIREAVMAAFPE